MKNFESLQQQIKKKKYQSCRELKFILTQKFNIISLENTAVEVSQLFTVLSLIFLLFGFSILIIVIY
jgi:hypothetical protein